MSEDALSVEVVIPVRNAARHLGRAIESVLAQQPTPADVVVVDGASSDGSVSVARNFAGVRNSRIKRVVALPLPATKA